MFGCGLLAALDQLADAGDARGAQQLAQLGELVLVAVGQRRDQVRALARAALRPLSRRLKQTSAFARGGFAARFMVAVQRAAAGRRARYWTWMSCPPVISTLLPVAMWIVIVPEWSLPVVLSVSTTLQS